MWRGWKKKCDKQAMKMCRRRMNSKCSCHMTVNSMWFLSSNKLNSKSKTCAGMHEASASKMS